MNAVGGAGRGPAAAAALAGGVGGGGVSLVAEEKLAISMSRDGGLQSFEVKGEMQLLVSDAAHGKALVPLVLGANSGYQFKTHPNINKPAFHNESELGLRDRSRPFPVGSTVGVLKWRMVSMDEAIVPLIINCWPTQTGGDAWEVTVEYELGAAYGAIGCTTSKLASVCCLGGMLRSMLTFLINCVFDSCRWLEKPWGAQ